MLLGEHVLEKLFDGVLIECVLKDLRNSPAVDFGIESTYLHAHMPKINSSSVKICESSQKVLKKFSKSSQKVLKKFSKKFSIVTRAVVVTGYKSILPGFPSKPHSGLSHNIRLINLKRRVFDLAGRP